MEIGILKAVGIGVLGGAVSGAPIIAPESGAPVLKLRRMEVQVTIERAGVDAEGCVLYRLRRVHEGRPLPVRAGLLWQSTAGKWTRFRPDDCVKPKTEGHSTP